MRARGRRLPPVFGVRDGLLVDAEQRALGDRYLQPGDTVAPLLFASIAKMVYRP